MGFIGSNIEIIFRTTNGFMKKKTRFLAKGSGQTCEVKFI